MGTIVNDVKKEKWICVQVGAREHYSFPKELMAIGKLDLMITDYWATCRIPMKHAFLKDLNGRRHPEIPNAKVMSFNLSSLGFEVFNRLKSKGWDKVVNRNQWFQGKAVNYLKSLKHSPTHVFSYSYAARDIFRYAKSKGWKTVLGQIDPGPLEEEIVLQELKKFPAYQSEWQPAPTDYWRGWHEECNLADEIIVNSEWSYNALVQKGIDGN